MNFQTSHLRPDGTTWPPVTPDPPPPPGYVDPIPELDAALRRTSTGEHDADEPAEEDQPVQAQQPQQLEQPE